jgi:hypothetical protein
LKEDGDRALTATQARAVEAAKSVAEMVAALDSIVDERASRFGVSIRALREPCWQFEVLTLT